jgi:hypothetical protein
MGWFIRSPFGRDEDPTHHMVDLLSKEAERAGTPLTDLDKETLAEERSSVKPLPDDLRDRAKELIARIFEAELSNEFVRGPKCFSSSLQWAGDLDYPNIVALAEEVYCDINPTASHSLHGWEFVKDRMQLIGCGVLAVLLMFAIGIGASFLFGWK